VAKQWLAYVDLVGEVSLVVSVSTYSCPLSLLLLEIELNAFWMQAPS